MNIDITNTTEHLNEIKEIEKIAAEKREAQRIKHNQYVKTYVPCTCSCKVMRCNMTSHRRTNKHQLLMETIKRNEESNKLRQTDHEKKIEILKLLVSGLKNI
ncbi:hypothetical protein, partial [Clostridium sp.]|uniref:hypothetical protein n=1 Tax=Clostridium sp. TaxID=1506 RepID=UPI0028513E7A